MKRMYLVAVLSGLLWGYIMGWLSRYLPLGECDIAYSWEDKR